MGVLGRNPETKQFPNGGSVTTFSVATTDFWKDKTTRERKEATEWHKITTSNRLAEIAPSTSRKAEKCISKAHCVQGSGRTAKGGSGSNLDSSRWAAIALMLISPFDGAIIYE